jgi:Uma2 family endonuclease
MIDLEILKEDERVELLAGEVRQMPPVGSPHAGCVKRLSHLFHALLGTGLGKVPRAIVSVQDPVELDDASEPEPDLALLRFRSDFYGESHPRPPDVLLIVEVSHTTLAADRRDKVPVYADALVPEVWLVDMDGDCVEVYREPSPRGYGWMRRLERGQRLASQAFPDLELGVEQILG